MDLSIIIVNWNSKDYVCECLKSILAETRGINYEIIVIDSASFDGCGEMLQERFPQVHYIQSDRNLGFVRANNAAFAVSRGKSVLFLNPDTELLGPAINAMYDRLQSLPIAGAVGCRLLNSDHTVQTSCIQSLPTILNQVLDSQFLRARWPRSPLWGMAPLFEDSVEPREVEGISGACLMLQREVFEQVGRFSEDYFMYAEDMDLCYRLREVGFRNYYVPEAAVLHHGGSSAQQAASDFSVIMMRESIWRFLRKNRGELEGLAYRIAMLASATGRLLLLAMTSTLQRLLGSSASANTSSRRKWIAALHWCLNREGWIRRHDCSTGWAGAPLRRATNHGATATFAAAHRSDP